MKNQAQSGPLVPGPRLGRHLPASSHRSACTAALGALALAWGFSLSGVALAASSAAGAASQAAPQAAAASMASITLRARAQPGGPLVEQGLAWTVRDGNSGQVLHESSNSGSIDLSLPHGLYEVQVRDPGHGLEAGGEISTLQGDRFTLTMSPQEADQDDDDDGESPEERAREQAMDEAQRRLEEAQARGDMAGMQAAQAEVLKISLGVTSGPYTSGQLRELIPDSLAGRQRSAIKTQVQSTLGLKTATLNASYGTGVEEIRLQITDEPAMARVLGQMLALSHEESEMEDERRIERSYREGRFFITEKYEKDGSESMLEVQLEDGFKIRADGAEPMDSLKPAILAILEAQQALQRPAAD